MCLGCHWCWLCGRSFMNAAVHYDRDSTNGCPNGQFARQSVEARYTYCSTLTQQTWFRFLAYFGTIIYNLILFTAALILFSKLIRVTRSD